MTATIVGPHEYTDVYPMLTEPEFDRLLASIAENGVRQAITIDAGGKILDGRNRWKATVELGIECPAIVYEGDDIAEFVIDANTRRDMTESQHAMCQAVILAKSGHRENGRWRYGSVSENTARGKSLQGWRNRLNEAGTVLDFAPDAVKKVSSGEMPLREALREAERRREYEREALEEQERIEAEEADALKKLADLAPDYLNRVGAEFKTGRQAFTAWEDDHRREAAEQRRNQAAAEKEAAEARKGRVALYSGISQSLATVSGYGNYPDLNTLMADFDANELDRSVTVEFTADRLNSGIRFLTMLKEWSER